MGDGEAAEKLLQLAGKTVSKGFVRSSNLYFIQPNARAEKSATQTAVTTARAAGGGGTMAEEVVNVRVTEVTQSRRAMQVENHKVARMKGYEGDACGECGNFTLVRNGTCLKCETCGATSGCS
jgi:ribonucleoside-diphosphate reductase alpha chain